MNKKLYHQHVHGLVITHSPCGWKYELQAVCDHVNVPLVRAEHPADVLDIALGLGLVISMDVITL